MFTHLNPKRIRLQRVPAPEETEAGFLWALSGTMQGAPFRRAPCSAKEYQKGLSFAVGGSGCSRPRIRRFLTKFGFIGRAESVQKRPFLTSALGSGTLYFVGPPLVVLLVSFFAPCSLRCPDSSRTVFMLPLADMEVSMEGFIMSFCS